MEVLRVAILYFCRRKKGKPFDPAEVVRQMFPQDWELFMEEILAEAHQMSQEGLIQLTQAGNPVDPADNSQSPFLILGLTKPK